MEFDPEDQDIIQVLAKLREIEAKYPEELLAARRHSYLQADRGNRVRDRRGAGNGRDRKRCKDFKCISHREYTG